MGAGRFRRCCDHPSPRGERPAAGAHRVAVERSYEFCERHLINLADVPSLRLTARDRIDLAAAEHGWSAQDDGVTRIYRKKIHGHLRVYFPDGSRVVSATTERRGLCQRTSKNDPARFREN